MSYIAMTIGPIIETISLARKTSEIWAASYLFSYLMKKIVDELRQKDDVTFLIPFTEDEKLFEDEDGGVGKFHDRFILQSDTLTLEEVEAIVEKHKNNLGQMVAKSVGVDENSVRESISEYLQTYILHTRKSFEHPILEISELLDSIELHTPFIRSKKEPLRAFLRRDVVLNSDMAKKSFGKKPSFLSIPAIAAQEKSADDIEQSDTFKNAYRYIAIVHADGDNLGKLIKSKTNSSEISKALFDFDEKAVETLKSFGAQTIFVGGDDLLFFAPVLHKDGRTIFDLIDALSENYLEAVGGGSTLSFGVSVTYFKYPLYEALTKSRHALFGTAKSYRGKNAVAVSFQKHSGQSFEFCVGKDEKGYEDFTRLLHDVLNETVKLPHAVHHKLSGLEHLIEGADADRLDHIFENFFNEDIHKKEFRAGLNALQSLFESIGVDEKSRKRIFSMLSVIKLLRGDR